MALIVLTSASGSPGVTTSAVGLALTWPRPALLVEADPTGGSSVLAGYLRGLTAQVARQDRGPAGRVGFHEQDRPGPGQREAHRRGGHARGPGG